MEVAVEVTVEDLTKDEPAKTALTAYFTFVALDAQGHSCPAPALELITEDDRRLFEAGRQRYLNYKQRKNLMKQEGLS